MWLLCVIKGERKIFFLPRDEWIFYRRKKLIHWRRRRRRRIRRSKKRRRQYINDSLFLSLSLSRDFKKERRPYYGFNKGPLVKNRAPSENRFHYCRPSRFCYSSSSSSFFLIYFLYPRFSFFTSSLRKKLQCWMLFNYFFTIDGTPQRRKLHFGQFVRKTRPFYFFF